MSSSLQRTLPTLKKIDVLATTDSTLPVARPLTHAVVLLPRGTSLRAQLTLRHTFGWQRLWLRRHNIPFTLVTDDKETFLDLDDVQSDALEHTSRCFCWNELCSPLVNLSSNETDTVLIIPAGVVPNCDITVIAREHLRKGHQITALREKQRSRRPLAYLCSTAVLEASWEEISSSLAMYALAPQGGLPFRGRLASVSTDAFVSTDAQIHSRRQMRALSTIAPNGVYIAPTARVAPTARLRAPIIIQAGAEVGEEAQIGPWVTIGVDAKVGHCAWVEHSEIGAGATLEDKACVYIGEVGQDARVAADAPVLKARMIANQIELQEPRDMRAPLRNMRRYRVSKRLLDVTLALVALFLLTPLLLVVACGSLVSSSWPVFFLHGRLGLNGRSFRVVKFRTMRHSSHHPPVNLETTPNFKLRDDPRVTSFGRFLRKTSIDELPQLLNVLRGEMSIVGPRPIITAEIARYGVYAPDLFSVLPGMTGLWQISGRSNTTYPQRVMLDVKYSDTCSLWGDVRILFMTAPAVLFLRGAH